MFTGAPSFYDSKNVECPGRLRLDFRPLFPQNHPCSLPSQPRNRLTRLKREHRFPIHWDGEYEASREANQGLAITAPYGFTAMILAVVIMFGLGFATLLTLLVVPVLYSLFFQTRSDRRKPSNPVFR